MSKDQHTEIIAYLEDEMSAGEQTAFESRMAQDETLQRQVNEYRVVLNGLEDQEMSLAYKKIHELEKNQPAGNQHFLFMKIAAAVVLLIATGGLLFYLLNKNADTDYQAYYTPYPNVANFRGGPTNNHLQEALMYYSHSEYDTAILLLNAIQSRTDTVVFYLGNAYLFSGQSTKAMSLFQSLISNNSPFEEQAEWLLTKAYLDQGKEKKAHQLLQAIASRPSHSYYQRAKEMQDDFR